MRRLKSPVSAGKAIRLDLEGVQLALEDLGSGEPTFLFVHGWTCNRSFFAPQARYFSRHHRVVSVDLRGHGESEMPRGAYPIEVYAEDLAAMIQRLNLGRVVVVGHSMGGLVALQLAAAHGESVTALVMIDPSPFEASKERLVRVEQLLRDIEEGNIDTYRRLLAGSFFLPSSDPDLVEDILEIMTGSPPYVAASALRGIRDFQALEAAKRVTVPSLHLAVTPPLNPPNRMAEYLPGVINGWTVGSGHFSQLEVPGQVNAMIGAFYRHYVHCVDSKT